MKKKTVELEIYKQDGSFGLTISRMSADGSGEGYRVFGPKLRGEGVAIKTKSLNEDDIDQIIDELLKSKKFLIGRST